MSVKENYQRVVDQVAEAAIQSGRNPNEITIVAVTKTTSWCDASILYQLGHRDFGESRLQEAQLKQLEAPKDCRWHFIGTLQKNKTRKAAGNFTLIHSIDSLELAKKLSEVSLEQSIRTSILLQVNTSGELSKHGMSIEECIKNYADLFSLRSLSIQGLMAMAPFVTEERLIRHTFASLRMLRDKLENLSGVALPHLSMGMSHDFPLAISEGATIVRIGQALFD